MLFLNLHFTDLLSPKYFGVCGFFPRAAGYRSRFSAVPGRLARLAASPGCS